MSPRHHTFTIFRVELRGISWGSKKGREIIIQAEGQEWPFVNRDRARTQAPQILGSVFAELNTPLAISALFWGLAYFKNAGPI